MHRTAVPAPDDLSFEIGGVYGSASLCNQQPKHLQTSSARRGDKCLKRVIEGRCRVWRTSRSVDECLAFGGRPTPGWQQVRVGKEAVERVGNDDLPLGTARLEEQNNATA